MRSFFKAVCRAVVAFLLLIFIAGCVTLPVFIERLPLFFGGQSYTFYLGTSSGRIVRSDRPVLAKLLLANVRGESAEFEGNVYEKWKDVFSAELVFCEEVAGVVNYYMYSPLLGEGVTLSEGEINLHIAVKGDRTAVGSPMIFGGY